MTSNLLPGRLLLAYIQYAGTNGYDIHLITTMNPDDSDYFAAMRRADNRVQVNISARAIDRIELPNEGVCYRVEYGSGLHDITIPYDKIQEVMIFDREHDRVLRYPLCHGFDPIKTKPVNLTLPKTPPRTGHLTVVK